eukprot:6172890-Pleurochrysis_carterae.AAC.1
MRYATLVRAAPEGVYPLHSVDVAAVRRQEEAWRALVHKRLHLPHARTNVTSAARRYSREGGEMAGRRHHHLVKRGT